jgi:hypothetical protein
VNRLGPMLDVSFGGIFQMCSLSGLRKA